VAADVAENLAAGDPWLVHRVPQVPADEPVVGDVFGDMGTGDTGDATSIMPVAPPQTAPSPAPVSLKTSLELMERIIAVEPDVIQDLWRSSATDEGRFTGLEQTILSAIAPVVDKSVRSLMTEQGRHRGARRIMNRLDAPSYALADSIQSLARKLDIEG
jgi:ABC-type Fe3+-hydroxamate transport system substrate-binding protein